MTVYWILLILTAIIAYTFGSVSTRNLASQFVFRKDLRRLGTGNVWLSNFRRVYKLKGFLLLLLVELVKDLLPILLGGLLLGIKEQALVGRVFAGFCLVLGNLFPVFNRFKGGHAIVAMVLTAVFAETSVGIVAVAVAVVALWFSKYVSVGAISGAAVLMVTAVLAIDDRLVMTLCILIALIVLIKHIPAISRLAKKTEYRLSFEEDISYKFDEKF